jgi:transposase
MIDDQTPRPVGRPSKLTPERVARLIDALRAGHTREGAAALAGISRSTFNAWLAAAKEPSADPELLSFLDAIKNAEIEAEDALLGIIRAAAPKQWQAAAWILERRSPDRWGRRVKAEIAAPPPAQPAHSEIERHIEEAQEAADMTARIANLCKARISFDEWPEEVQVASGFRQ